MSSRWLRNFTGLLLIAAFYCSGVQGSEATENKKLKIFILAGQSNMEGQARHYTMAYMGEDPATADLLSEMVDAKGMPRTVENAWISFYQSDEPGDAAGKAYGPLTAHYGWRRDKQKEGDKFGPEFTFGITMRKALEEPILIIKTAWGGKSIAHDFRPPSAGPYELTEREIERIQKRGDDLDIERERIQSSSGHYYRLMMDHVKHVLKDIKRVCPVYDEKAGYEIAGFVWFQGWNDLVNTDFYPDRDKQGGYDEYSKLLAMFIRDVRNDLKTSELPFVIGVMGVNGPIENVEEPYRDIHGNFRKAMAAPAMLPDFRGNVIAVETAPYWDMDLDPLMQKRDHYNSRVWQLKKREREGELTKDELAAELKQIEGMDISPDEEKLLKRGTSDGAYHYMGSAKVVSQIGRAFARAVLQLKGPLWPTAMCRPVRKTRSPGSG